MAHPVDPGSDVDWDPPEDTEAAMPIVREKVPPEMRPFPLKRRLKQKTNVRRFVPEGFKAVRPAICPESRLSRELGAPLYSVQLGTRKTKPRLLYPLVLAELQNTAPQLHAVCGRENGQVYFSAIPLSESVTVMRLLEGARDIPEFYSRLPLLTTPSTFVPLPTRTPVLAAPDAVVDDIATTDGQAEVSVATARKLGFLVEEAPLYSTWQFRAVLPLEGGFCLCKGMLLVNPNVQGILLRDSCIKVRWQAGSLVHQQDICNFVLERKQTQC